eukprot:TRINITY_DN11435_c0_g1_i1.p1 TRINITY_DN11435_c0_g1~~TRINITY_DN11435_c0_g1_i1.p1  ORF type:complete len:514 (-),score=92.76 TRINITY_DN11435_c0_g1_i1:72-1403(-)
MAAEQGTPPRRKRSRTSPCPVTTQTGGGDRRSSSPSSSGESDGLGPTLRRRQGESDGLGPTLRRRQGLLTGSQGAAVAGHGASAQPAAPAAATRREKAFAWMDSEDESGSGEDGGVCAEGSAPAADATRNEDAAIEGDTSKGGGDGVGDASPNEEHDDDAKLPAPSRIEEVRTFGEFVRFAPVLMRAVDCLETAQLAAVCSTAVRLKYFDADLFRVVYKALVRKFVANEVDGKTATDIAQHLADLNAYDDRVFSAAIASLEPRIQHLSKEQRLRWLTILEQVGHRGSPAFVEALRLAPLVEDMPVAATVSGKIQCRHFAKGFCVLGRSCTFAHEEGIAAPPLITPTVQTQTQFLLDQRGRYPGSSKPTCRFFQRGFCSAGKGCAFAHPGAEDSIAGFGFVPQPTQSRPPLKLNRGAGVCVHFAAGGCSWGDKCHYVHAVIPRL